MTTLDSVDPDDGVPAFFHADGSYDPAKAREYYLRTRKLKGRKKGAVEEATGRLSSGTPGSNKPTKPKLSTKAATEARVAAQKARIERLRKILDSLIKQAKARSGVKDEPSSPSSSKDSKNSKDSAKDRKPLTAKQKREAAKRSAEAYAKELTKSPSKKASEQHDEIVQLEEKIKAIRKQLKAAVEKDRQKITQTKTATIRR